MKRLVVTFIILVVLLAMAGIVSLLLIIFPAESTSDSLPSDNTSYETTSNAQHISRTSSPPAEANSASKSSSDDDERVGEGEDVDVHESEDEKANKNEESSAGEGNDTNDKREGGESESVGEGDNDGGDNDDSEDVGVSEDESTRAQIGSSSSSLIRTANDEVKVVKAQLDSRLSWFVDDLVVSSAITIDGAPLTKELAQEIILASSNYTSRVNYIDQQEVMPSGCEIIALTAALRAEGFDAFPNDLAERLQIGSNVATQYLGSPYENGGGLPPCIVDAANAWLGDQRISGRAYNLTGTSLDDLEKLVEKGYPILVWTTEDMSDPKFTGPTVNGLQWYNREHCVVLYGIEEDTVLVSDSLEGLTQRSKERFMQVYDACGRKSAFALPNERPRGMSSTWLRNHVTLKHPKA